MPDTVTAADELAAPEPGLASEEMIARAAALRPLLRAQQDANDRLGRYSEELHEAFRRAGLYRILQPRRFGGYERDPEVFLRVVLEIARGHPGAGWCFALGASHGYLLAAHWPEAVQRELFGPDGEFRAPGTFTTTGRLTPVEGGYLANGTWPTASGVPYATHFLGAGFADRVDGPPRHILFATPRETIQILPDWGDEQFLGMQASGSHSVRLDNVFVPERYVVDNDFMHASPPGGTPGTRLHGNPIYLAVLGGWFNCEFGAILTGAARAALEEFEGIVRTKPMLHNPGVTRMHDPFIQHSFARALGLADSAEALTFAAVGRYQEHCRRFGRDGTPISELDTYEVWGMASEACRMACEAVEILFHAVGASAGRRGQRLQRYFRDIEAYRLHPQSQPLFPTMRGRTAFGLPPQGLSGPAKG